MVRQKADTIFALASARGRAGVAVIRLSGPLVFDVLKSVSGISHPRPRVSLYSSLFCPDNSENLIDDAVILPFRAPNSFTGEDVVELHVHGSPVVVEKLMTVLAEDCGLRLAEPGEFTRRAFENGKLDLTEAEGIHDLVVAETEAQRKQALQQMRGALGVIYEKWRHALLSALGELEATIDFSDEELPPDLQDQVGKRVKKLKEAIKTHLNDSGRSERIRTGFLVAIVGPPNAGKSSLLNKLAKDDVAIVSDIAGTTRDTLEVRMDLGGYAVTLVDTAGLREAGDAIEAEGVRRALKRAEDADMRIFVMDASEKSYPSMPKVRSESDDILILNKSDKPQKLQIKPPYDKLETISLSALSGEGLDSLISVLEKRVVDDLSTQDHPGVTRMRHRLALAECLEHLDRFLQGHDDPALSAEDLRMASRALGRITGRVDVEDMLDIVFSEFCIGK